MWYQLLADLILVLHTAVVLFVVGGQVLILAGWWRGWSFVRNSAFRIAHLATILFVVVQSWLGAYCPLTIWEHGLRVRAGKAGYGEASFIGYWLERFLYYHAPHWVFVTVYTLFGLVVLASFLGCPPRFVRRRG
jgi:hypothetical protein